MKFAQDSIQKHLMLSFTLTTGIALATASVAFFGTEVLEVRVETVEGLSVLARVIGTNCGAPLLFDDAETAAEVLAALEAHDEIITAAVYRTDGQLFASWSAAGGGVAEQAPARGQGHAFGDGTLDLFEPIVLQGDEIGTVVIRAGTSMISEYTHVFGLIVMGIMLAALLISYVGASLLRRRIADPLATLVEGAGRMADGDLSVRVDVTSNDELGVLAQAFNAMASSLCALISQVRDNTRAVTNVSSTLHQVSDAMREEGERQEAAGENAAASIERINESVTQVNSNVETLSNTALDTSAASTQMNSSIAQIASHMDSLFEAMEATGSSVVEMTSAIREIARGADNLEGSTHSTAAALGLLSAAVGQVKGNARETQALSEKTFEEAERGAEGVDETIRGMGEIQVSFRGLESIILDLSEKSESIGEVIKVIAGVVDQTALLALNARIISAQSGEQGRAFAVVAEQVRALASSTAGSTREISELIESVQLGITDAVGAMAHGRARVDRGVDLSTQAGQFLRTIGESARQSATRVGEIVEASEGQAHEIEHVNDAMSRLGEIAAQLNRGTHEQDNARADITRSVEQMRDLGQQVKRSTQEQHKESALISQSVEVVASRIEEIFNHTREQQKQGDQILEALRIFREISQEGELRREEMRQSLNELSERSQGLEDEVGRFSL